jgi:hypothetical protein
MFSYVGAKNLYHNGIPCVDDLWDSETCTFRTSVSILKSIITGVDSVKTNGFLEPMPAQMLGIVPPAPLHNLSALVYMGSSSNIWVLGSKYLIENLNDMCGSIRN